MSARQLDLLEKLCTLLEGLPPERFDYSLWASGDLVNRCGTVGCALGWATAIPETGLTVWAVGGIARVSGEETHWNTAAGAVAFGLELEDADALFLWDTDSPTLGERSPKETASALEVAAWIRRHIEAWRADGAA